jgi:hypothetical protein
MSLKFLFPAIILVHCNVTWLIVVWSFDLLHWLAAFLLVIVFPIFASVAVGGLALSKIGDDLMAVVAAASILFPIVYGVSHATRMPDYVRFVHSGRDAFQGAVSEIESGTHLFYALDDFLIKNLKTEEEFGVSYSSTTRKSSTTHAKHFAVPVFDAKEPDAPPRLWLCDTYKSGSLRSDNYEYNLYGFEKTSLSQSLNPATLYGKRGGSDDCRRAVAQYLTKKNAPPLIEKPLLLELVGEPPEDYYRTARRHYWMMTAVLNLLFLGLSFFSLKKTGNL